MGIEHELAFEDEIVAALEADGWLYSPTAAGYEKTRALFPDDVFAWLQETQPTEWAKVIKPEATAAEQAKAKEQLLDRLVKTLDLPLDAGGGTLNVLRRGFKKTPASFSMCEFKPATSFNQAALARHEAVRLRVMRQVYYSSKNANSLDLVLFVNGLPVATLELKTDNTQSIDDAIAQYRHHRDPRGESLLGFANRALVHFAVSTDEVAMTTRLAGKATHFLPFNLGDDGAAGNPVNPGGAASAYLWERVLQRDAWLHIFGKLLHLEKRNETDPITGSVTPKTTLLFPRFHQWELVTNLLETVRAEGPGNRYLVMHSAGSGKTNSISWLAHGLSNLHDPDDTKVFDTVIVVTDRTVLDDQLQKAIKQIEGVDGTVATINADEVRKANDAVTSKSGLLAAQLLSGKLIVIVTMQTFPFALKAIRENKGLAGRNFAIIADEAHSSQTGRVSQKLREVLTADEQADLADGGEIDTEAVLAAEMEARADSPNLSFFAFTATPKAKTLELFGRKDADGLPRPFHVYSMQQAIEEGYILDVLKNYTTYDTAFQIAETSRRHLQAVETVTIVDEAEATKGLMRWVSLHPTNIAQKVQIIVEHYRTNVRHLLDGHAKAMVVTSSREHAVRYKEAIDAYIAKKGYGLATLVAFSGTLSADQVAGVTFAGIEPPYSEANLNRGLRGRTLPVAFGTDDFQVLIVANKYQTGFDQPLLCAMYVDKRLSGVTAVQTLSRLNRTYPSAGKDVTYVLDFVNDPEEILTSFKPYYRDAELTETTDPDIVHDVQAKLDSAGIYTDAEVDAFTTAFLTPGAKHGAHTAPLKSAADRFNARYLNAVADGDRASVEELDLFRKDVGSFIRLYDFLSQIVNYADTGLEKRSLYLRLLLPRLTGRAGADAIDFSEVELTHIKQARSGDHTLDLASGESSPLQPLGATGSGAARDPRMVRLAEILARINELFADEDFTASGIESWVQGVVTVLTENPQIRTQAAANSRTQFVESPDLNDAVTDAVLGNQTSHNSIVDYYFSRPEVQVELVKRLGELVHENLQIELNGTQAVGMD
ncbi:type I restriction endonuclease subunit R [Agromyces bauzanensis]